MKNKLKPCPFCGGEASIHTYVNGNAPVAHVRCEKCLAETVHKRDIECDGENIEHVIFLWNRRVTDADCN